MWIEIEGKGFCVDVEDYGYLPAVRVIGSNVEFYVAESREQAGKKAREY